MDNSEAVKKQQELMYLEFQRVNKLIYRSFKKCVLTLTNKVLGSAEKTCIKDYLSKEKLYQDELLQALTLTNMYRAYDEINTLKSQFK